MGASPRNVAAAELDVCKAHYHLLKGMPDASPREVAAAKLEVREAHYHLLQMTPGASPRDVASRARSTQGPALLAATDGRIAWPAGQSPAQRVRSPPSLSVDVDCVSRRLACRCGSCQARSIDSASQASLAGQDERPS